MFNKQERLAALFGMGLCFIAGYLDIYAFSVRGVFAAMQTGNLITLFTSLIDKNYELALIRGSVILVFFIGLFFAEWIKRFFQKRNIRIEIGFLTVGILLLIPASCIPIGTNSFWIDFAANQFLAIFAAIQLAGFTSLNGEGFVSTMMTGVMKNISFHLANYISQKERRELSYFFHYLGMLLSFILGIVVSYLLLFFLPDHHIILQVMPLFMIPVLILEIFIARICFPKKIQ